MMTRKSNFLVRRGILAVVLVFSLSNVFAQTENKKWTIAAEKFKYSKGQISTAVTEATAEMIPSRIMENLGRSLVRSVEPDERLDRIRYDSRKERISLFLQLSNEYKKRDALVLNNYSERELKKKISEQEQKVQEVKNKIEENLTKLKDAEKEAENLTKLEEKAKLTKENVNKSELWKYSSLVKNLFSKDEEVFTYEDVKFYKNDVMSLYSPSADAVKNGYLSYPFEKECVSAGINTLITGNITSYGDYLSVYVELYLYPGAKKIGSVMEVGSLQEMDFLCSSIARQIIPMLANSMPVQVQIAYNKDEVSSEVFMYVDDQLQTNIASSLMLDSGVHTIQFTSEGYNTVATSYFFEGNTKYLIEVQFQEQKDGSLYVGLNQTGLDKFYQKLPFHKEYSQYGTVYANGVAAALDEENRAVLTINGNKILGQFITNDGATAFYYIPEKLILDGSKVSINPKAFDRSEYIDTRRKWMYGTYSMLITSLIPTFFCSGNWNTYKGMLENAISDYKRGAISSEEFDKLYSGKYDEANKWYDRYMITSGISIGCGVLFVFELVRYFVAANSVLPQKAKATEYINPMPVKILSEDAVVPGTGAEVETAAASETNESEEEITEISEITEITEISEGEK